MHRFDIRTIQNVEIRRKTFKTTQNYESNQIIMHRIDLTSKRSEKLSTSLTTKVIKLQWIASIWHQNNPKCWDTSQNIQTTQTNESDSNYNAWHRFDVLTIKTFEFCRKTTKVIKFIVHCIDLTSKRSKLLSYVPKLQKWSNYKSNQSTMNCIDLTS